MNKTISVKITSPEEILWEGRAKAVSSENSQGPFDVMPKHANFITLIKNKPIIIHKKAKKKKFKFDRAVLFNRNNEVVIYITPYTELEKEKRAGKP